MKLKITPGPWEASRKDNGKSYSIHVADTSFAEVYLPFNADDETELESNAEAIVTAVNNTYHKGINPEAVPEMLEFLAAIARHPKNDTLADFLIDDAKKLIQKSTL